MAQPLLDLTAAPMFSLFDAAGRPIPLDEDPRDIAGEVIFDRLADIQDEFEGALLDAVVEQASALVSEGRIVHAALAGRQLMHTVGLTSFGLPELALLDYPYDNHSAVLTGATESVLAHGRPEHRERLCGVGCADHPYKAIVPEHPMPLWFINYVYARLDHFIAEPDVMLIVTPGADGLFDWETPYTPPRRERRHRGRRSRK